LDFAAVVCLALPQHGIASRNLAGFRCHAIPLMGRNRPMPLSGTRSRPCQPAGGCGIRGIPAGGIPCSVDVRGL